MQVSHARRLLAVAAAVEFATGVSLYAFPTEFSPILYAPLIPYFPQLSAALFGGGLMLLLTIRYRLGPVVRHLLPILAAIPLFLLARQILLAGGFTGGTAYLCLGVGIAVAPWVEGGALSRRLYTLTLGAIHLGIGALWTLLPGIFTSPAFQPIQPALRGLGLFSLVVGGVMLSPLLERLPQWGRRLLGAALPLLLAYTFLRTATWTGLSLWIPCALGALIPHLRESDRREIFLPHQHDHDWIQRTLAGVETWTWLLALLVVALTAILGAETTETLPRALVFVLMLGAYNLIAYWLLPPMGSARAQIHLHLFFVSAAIGVLLSGAPPIAGALLPILLAIPMVAARTSGSGWGYTTLSFALLVLVISGLTDLWLYDQPARQVALTLSVELFALAATGAVGVMAAASQRRTVYRLQNATHDLDLQVRQLGLVDQIGRSVRSSLDLQTTLRTTVQKLGLALRARQGYIQLTDGSAYTFDESGREEPLTLTPAQEETAQRAQLEGCIVASPEGAPFLAAPILTDAGTLGVIAFRRDPADEGWKAEERAFVEAVVGQVAVAVAHARTHEALTQRHGELEAANQLLAAQSEELAAQQEELITQHQKVLEQSAVLRAQRDELEESETRFRTTFVNAPYGMALISLDRVVLQANHALANMLGYTPAELAGCTARELSDPEDYPEHLSALEAVIAGQRDGYSLERRMLHRDGHSIWVAITTTVVRDAEGYPLYLIGQFVDVTERRLAEERLQKLANYDSLTDLLNRRRFEIEVEGHLASASRTGSRAALLFLDFDQFKFVNDSLGHRAGDQLLKGLARVLDHTVAGRGPVARLGGDEFAIFLPGVDVDQAEILATDLLESVRSHIDVVGGQQVGITVSIGIAIYPQHGTTVEDLMLHADLAMYQAKDGGRNCHRVYTAGQTEAEMGSKLNWERRIREALAEDRFVLHFQPILSLAENTVTEYEALLRLREPDGTLIPPRHFLDVAESYGLIHALDRWVVCQAIRTIAEQRRKFRPITLAVNLSARAFSDYELLPLIKEELLWNNVDPAALTFEITETAAVADIKVATQFIETLTGMGCRFALDDFGAGLSSLYYLKKLPVSCLKIDGSFIQRLPTEPIDQKMVRAVVTLARELGMRTVAEYVGNEETVALLRELGVDAAQGYYIGRSGPLPE